MDNVILNSNNKGKQWKMLSLTVSFTLSFFLSTIGQINAQADCNHIMACNNLVQISLNANCTETITPGMILEKANLPNASYEVITKTKAGVVLPNNILTRASIGVPYDVSVSVKGCGISCWGSITVEDKFAPTITCPSDTVNCGQSIDPSALKAITAMDGCGSVTRSFVDAVKISQCTDQFVKVINRTWTATDLHGNISKCIQTINFIRPTIENVSFPSNYDDADQPAFRCGDITDLLPNGAPSPDITGRPGGTDCPNIMFYYEDVIFPICGEAKKILRKWNVIDWCTGKDTTHSQIIKIIDNAPPVCVSSPDFLYKGTTDEGKCTGTFRVPAPTIIFECSAYTYEVSYKLRGPDGKPFVNPTTAGIIKTTNADSSYYFTIPNLPADTSWIIYTITDACGNSSQCFTETLIEDKEAPTAVCEGYNVISLDNDGVAAINASSVNAGSNDNCSISKFEIKRVTNNCGYPEDLTFRDQVRFCCTDISATAPYQSVILRVYDHVGNYSECTSNVKVQDKRTPTISDVPDITLDCGVNFKNTTITGRPTFSDNCTIVLDSSDTGTLVCGQGIITRTWKVTDRQGLIATSQQVITLRDLTPFGESNIVWPEDKEVNGCKESDAHPDIINSRPTFTNVECADIAMSFSDQQFQIDGACVKLLRTWRIINWCTANAQNPAYITHIQKILLKNSVAPTFTSGCENREFIAANSACSHFVEHKVTATDDCTTASDIKFTWSLDTGNNGSIDENGNGSAVSKVYPIGTHRITFTAKDACQNDTTCSYTFTIKDQKAPTPICNTSIATTLNDQKQAEIWASDFDHKSFDLCDSAKLTFSFDSLGLIKARTFTCSDIENGVSHSVKLKVWVADRSNNRDFCEVNLILQDPQNRNQCPNIGLLTANIFGKVENKASVPFNQLAIELENMETNKIVNSMTNLEGQYTFSSVAFFDGYTLKPKKTDDILNGVSTLDLVFIQRHILGIKAITDQYDIIAADINSDKKLTASDLVGLRKVILGVDQNFPNSEPWKFIPADFDFANVNQPWDYPTLLTFDQLQEDQKDNNFIAVKVGDVNNSAVISASNAMSEVRSKSTINVDINKLPNSMVELTFISNDNIIIAGLQLGLDLGLDNNATIEKISSDQIDISRENIALSNGKLLVSFASDKNVNASNLVFKVMIKTSNTLNNNLKSIESFNEVYDENYQPIPVDLILLNNSKSNELVTISPNPFSQTSTITFNSNDEGNVKFTISDITGRIIYETLEKSIIGINTIGINRNQLGNKAGIYFFNIEKSNLKHTGALILAE